MPRNRNGVITLNDFTGGLNLRADQFQLAPNESPDMLNVEVDPRGGFALRRGISVVNDTDLTNDPLALWDYQSSAGTKQVLVQHGTKIGKGTGGDFTDLAGITQTVTDRCQAATFQDVNYIVNGTDDAVKWDGTTATRLGHDWNADYAAPVNGDMPIAKCIAYHMGLLFVANTSEDGSSRPNRVRWSHPNKAEDWKQLDFIDVSPGADGDEIVGLVSFFDRLLVFKRRSVHAIYGFSPENFQVQPITDEAGAISFEAICQAPEAVYFYSWPDGVFRYDGRKLEWLFEKLYPAFQLGDILDDRQDDIRLGFGARKLWCSVPWEAAAYRMFMFDPTAGKRGAWTAHDLNVGKVYEWRPVEDDTRVLAITRSSAAHNKVLLLEQEKGSDDYGDDDTHIDSYYITPWVDARSPISDKRWKRLRLSADTDIAATVTVEMFRDFDRSSVRKRHTYSFDGIPSGVVAWGAVGVDWGDSGVAWSSATGRLDEVVRGAPLGNAKSFQLRIVGPTENARWAVHMMALPFIEKPVR